MSPRKRVARAGEDVWRKHAGAIVGSEVKTIKDIVVKLRPGIGRKPSIRGGTRGDAATMLIDIGLSAFPHGFIFKEVK